MIIGRARRLADGLFNLFPERRLVVHSGGEARDLVLTPHRQMAIAAAAGLCVLWMGVSTLAALASAVGHDRAEAALTQTQA